MNKLEEHRNRKSGERTKDFENSNFQELWREGFDAAIALELPVKFLDFYLHSYLTGVVGIGRTTLSKEQVEVFKEFKKLYPFQEERDEKVYQYWIENIYKS